jgi:hypothetical protein
MTPGGRASRETPAAEYDYPERYCRWPPGVVFADLQPKIGKGATPPAVGEIEGFGFDLVRAKF